MRVFLGAWAALGLLAASAFAEDAVGLGRQHANETAANLSAILHSCEKDIQDVLGIAAPQTPSDADEDVPADTRLQELAAKLDRRSESFRELALTAGFPLQEGDPAKLEEQRKRYSGYRRSRELNRAAGEMENALRRRRIDQVVLEPSIQRMLSELKGFRSDFRRVRGYAAELARQDPSREWKRRLADMDRDASDLGSETRLLEIYLTLAKLQDLNMDSNW